ncbi:hypothetical protein Taro_030693, partial [Colocasia esculenta]|nr:hypothetical protein [Colocasia esculenta]
RHHRGVGGLVVRVPLEHYKGGTFEDAVTFVPTGIDPSDWQTMCEKWNTREEQVKTNQREADHMQVFRMGRCKHLPDGTQQWVDDESNDHFMTAAIYIGVSNEAYYTVEEIEKHIEENLASALRDSPTSLDV